MKQLNLLLNFFMNDPKPQFILTYPSLNVAYANNAARMVYRNPFEEGTSILDFHPDFDTIIEKHKKESYFHHQDTLIVNRQILKLNFTFFKSEEQQETYYHVTINPSFEPIHRATNSRINKYCQGNGIVIVDKELNIIDINKTYTTLFGFKREEVLGKPLLGFLSECDQEENIRSFNDVIEGAVIRSSIKHMHKDSSVISVSVIATPFFVNNTIEGGQFFFQTELPKYGYSNELFKSIINNYKDGVIVTDHNRKIIWVNPAFTRITGYTFDEVQGKNPRLLKSGIQSKEFYEEMWSRILESGHFFGEIWNRKKNGDIYPQWTDFFTLRDEHGKIINYVSIFKDLDDVDSVNRNILLMLQKDPLTLVYNRTYFLDLAHRSLKKLKGQTSYLLFLDIDNYKPINDTYGHYIGDQVLIQYAQNLLKAFKGSIIGRYGGDEFLILTTSPITREQLIQTIIQFNPTVEVEDKMFHVTTSFGVVELQDDEEDINAVINKADHAMYLAKQKRLKYLFYTENLTP